MGVQRDSPEHILARAEFFKGLITKTTDPVHWEEKKLREAKDALARARELEFRRYETAYAMIENAWCKSV
jgi:hypothetical protein